MFNRGNLFGGGPGQGNPPPNQNPYGGRPPPRDPYASPGVGPGGSGSAAPYRQQGGAQQGYPQAASQRATQGGGSPMMFRLERSPDDSYTFGNRVAVSPSDFPRAGAGNDFYVLVNKLYVLTARPADHFPSGAISFSEPQRTWAQISLTDRVQVEEYEPLAQGGQAYLGSMDVEISFAGRKRTEAPYDQDELAKDVTRVSNWHN